MASQTFALDRWALSSSSGVSRYTASPSFTARIDPALTSGIGTPPTITNIFVIRRTDAFGARTYSLAVATSGGVLSDQLLTSGSFTLSRRDTVLTVDARGDARPPYTYAVDASWFTALVSASTGWSLTLDDGAVTAIRNVHVGDKQIERIYVGSTEIVRAYIGDTQVFGEVP